MNLIVCPTRLFAVYLLAYLTEYGAGRRFHLVIVGERNVPKEYVSLGYSLNATFITESEMKENSYEELIIHTYCFFDQQQKLLDSLSYKHLTFYSDALRNGMYGLANSTSKVTKLIYFGLILRDLSFDLCLPESEFDIKREVVSLSQIGKTLNSLKEGALVISSPVFNSKDLLLVMRYWNMPENHYAFKSELSILQYLKAELEHIEGVDRVIYRSHPWFDHQISRLDLQWVFGDNVEIVLWEELYESHSNTPEYFQPEAIIWSSPDQPKYFFGFDSTLNMLVAHNWPNTQIIWPRSAVFSDYFQLRRSSNIVQEQIAWMKLFVDKTFSGGGSDIEVSGIGMQQALSEVILRANSVNIDALTQERDALTQERDALTQERDALTQERDALTQERDALTQERDALTQERDALTQERDALTNSTIWRRTLFIRRVVARLRQLK